MMRVIEKVGEGALVPATDGLLKEIYWAPRVQGSGLYDDGINILGTLPPIESEYQCSGVRSEGSGQPKRVPTR